MSAVSSHLSAGIVRSNEGEHHHVIGTTIRYKSLSHETDGAAFIWESETPPGAVVPPHIHHVEDEFIYLFEGELQVTIGDDRHTVHPGDLVKMPKGVPHAVVSSGTSISRSLWTVVPAGKMESLFRALAALPADQPPNPEQIVKIFMEHDVTPLPPPG
jgi:quercetin dioxygenase-like cupin family protein